MNVITDIGAQGLTHTLAEKARTLTWADLPDDARVAAEVALPARIAEHGHRVCARRFVFVGVKRAPVNWLHAEHVEIIA